MWVHDLCGHIQTVTATAGCAAPYSTLTHNLPGEPCEAGCGDLLSVVWCSAVTPAGAGVCCCPQSGEGQKPPQLVPVHPGSTVREVLSLLVTYRLHRLHVIDARNKPVGIVTITDLLRVIVGCNELLQAFGPVRRCAG